GCAPSRQARSIERVSCTITSEVSLVAGARRLEIRTTVANAARDHRLRALFPLPFVATAADAEDTFTVTRRLARQSRPGHDEPAWSEWAEPPLDTHPPKLL